jgi:preprotein translocase subunit SecA
MRIFGSDRIASIMNTLGLDEETPIENKLVSGAWRARRRRWRATTLTPASSSWNTTM